MPEPPSTPDQNRSALQLLRRLWPFLAPFRAQLACLAVVVLFSIPLNLTTPLPLTLAVDSVIGDRPLPHVLQSWLPQDVCAPRQAHCSSSCVSPMSELRSASTSRA